ncbi:MAG: HAD family phosphatase [Candidatus Peribacteraceae bacterium]|nr:HAD family phosphatase [Candidatus Peribacteraceae bacterium]
MQAVIFDFDGVVVDSQLHWDRLGAAHVQKVLPTWDDEKQKRLKGHNNQNCYDILTQDFGFAMPYDGFVTHVRLLSKEIYEVHAGPTAGIEALLDRLAPLVPLPSIASASERQWIELLLGRIALRGRFGDITTSDEVARSKPAPDVYLKAADKLGLAPADCLAIEDTDAGGAAAAAAGMRVVGFHPPGQDWQAIATAHRHIHSFDELTGEALRTGI